MSMVMGSLTGRMGDRSILPVKLPVTISTMLNFDRDCDGDRHGVGMCKHTLIEQRPKRSGGGGEKDSQASNT